MNSISKIIDYIEKKNNQEWLLSYLPALRALTNEEAHIDDELLDMIIKNMQNLIYSNNSEISLNNTDNSKDLLFYNNFINSVKNSLYSNKGMDNKKHYDFLLFPGLSPDVGCIEVCRYKKHHETHHVFIMEIPEKLLKNKKELCIILCHEIAHYVGTVIRSREVRLKKIYDIYSRGIVLGIKTSLMHLTADCSNAYIDYNSPVWTEVEAHLTQWIELYYQRETNPEFIRAIQSIPEDNQKVYREIAAYNRANEKHMFYIEPTMLDAISDMLMSKYPLIFESVITDCFKQFDYEERELLIEQSIQSITTKTHIRNNIYSLSGIWGISRYLLQESYADLISIQVLKLSPQEYFDCITAQYPEVEISQYSNMVIARIALVVFTMCRMESKCRDYVWMEEDLLQVSNQKSVELKNVIDKYIQLYIANSHFEELDKILELSNQVYIILKDKAILKPVIEYLIQCRKSFKENAEQDELDTIRKIYQNS